VSSSRPLSGGRTSEQHALPDRRRQRAFVEIVELAAHRRAVGKPRHLHLRIGEQFGDVVRCGLAVDGGVERKDDFLDLRLVGPRDQPVNDLVQRTRRARVMIVSPNMAFLAIQLVRKIRKDAELQEAALTIRTETGLMAKDVSLRSRCRLPCSVRC
jgi:hypothetical protein